MPHQAVVCKDSTATQVRVAYYVTLQDGKSVAHLNDCLHVAKQTDLCD